MRQINGGQKKITVLTMAEAVYKYYNKKMIKYIIIYY